VTRNTTDEVSCLRTGDRRLRLAGLLAVLPDVPVGSDIHPVARFKIFVFRVFRLRVIAQVAEFSDQSLVIRSLDDPEQV
jgi:hypothetical protein